MAEPTATPVSWLAPQRPVEGGTVNVKPEEIIAPDVGRDARKRKVVSLDVASLWTIADAANEFMISGLCGDPDQGWRQLLIALREAGLADS